MKLFLIMLGLFGFSSHKSVADEPDDQLWIMIKTDSYFRGHQDMIVLDAVTSEVERLELGYLDGHSSGAHQFDFNFMEVKEFEATKSLISKFIDERYPNLTYMISNGYEMKYEKL